MIELVWKTFTDDAEPPSLLKPKKRPSVTEGKVTVTCFRNGWCPAQNLACERMKRAVSAHAEQVNYIEVDTDCRERLEEWGIADGIYVDGVAIAYGPPPSYEKLHKTILKRLKKIRAVS
jgi:hypothetical protein